MNGCPPVLCARNLRFHDTQGEIGTHSRELSVGLFSILVENNGDGCAIDSVQLLMSR